VLYTKISVNRHKVKVMSMEKMNVGLGKKKKKSSNVTSDEERKENYSNKQKRSCDKVIDDININFKAYSSCFVTLTFVCAIDIEEAKKRFANFLKNMRRTYINFKYVVTIEFQDRGTIHYHFICNIPDSLDATDSICNYWNGGINVKEVYYVDGLAIYMTKEFINRDETSPLFGKHCYMSSQYLDKPYIVTSWGMPQEEFKNMKSLLIKGNSKKRVIINSEKAGVIEYNTYKRFVCTDSLLGDYVLAKRKGIPF